MYDNEYRWLTPLSQDFLSKDYLIGGQTVDDRVRVVGGAAESILGKPGFADRFRSYMQRGWFSLSTPIWTNFGNSRGLPISCFGTSIGDSMESILRAHAEVGMQTKHGGGTSAYFGHLRGRGAAIRDNGESSGSVHFMEFFDTLINLVSQGKTRRGNFAAYLPIDHPDAAEFLKIRSEGHPIQDLSFGVCVPDAFMEGMIAGDKSKRELWASVIRSRAATGFPYIMWPDTANANTVDVYRDKGMKITHSNLCVTGDQRVVSDRGLKTAKQLFDEGGGLTLFDNKGVVTASPMELIERNADVYRITLDNGMTHTVTADHMVVVRTTPLNDTADVACRDLKPGDLVAVQTAAGLFGTHHDPQRAFLLGLYQGDGTQTDKLVAIDLWENDFDLVDEIERCVESVHRADGLNRGVNNRVYDTPTFGDCVVSASSTVRKKRLPSYGLKKIGFQKGVVPDWVWAGDRETQWQYVRGLFYTDGTVNVGGSKGNPLQLSLPSVDRPFLQSVQLILANLGMKTSIRLLREAGPVTLPDGKGGQREYDCRDCWRLIIGNKPDAVEFNKNTGFLDRKGVVLEDREYRNNAKKFYAVESVEHVGKEDVYCCKVETDAHHWVCNGIVTHNCTEIFLPDDEEESFVCDLSSMNLLHYDEWKDTDAVETLVTLLDAVMTEFIRKAEGIPFMERPVRFAKRHRALGVGQLGWHSYLQSRMIPFESMEAKRLNVAIAKTIKEQAYAASERLAREYGEPEVLEGYGRRNTTLCAIAPTKSSAFILGQVSEGVEPARSNFYIKDLAKGKYTIKHPQLDGILTARGHNNPATWDGILKRGGSVQHLDCLDQHEKAVFRTFAEISPMEVIQQAAQRQAYIDQGQSLNLMIDPHTPAKDVNALLIEAWRSKVKSLYYQIGVNAAQTLGRSILACTSCEG